MMIALLLTLAAVSYAEGQQAAANHEVPAGTRTVEPLAGDFPVGRWECWFEPQAHADIAAGATGYRARPLRTPSKAVYATLGLRRSATLGLEPAREPHYGPPEARQQPASRPAPTGEIMGGTVPGGAGGHQEHNGAGPYRICRVGTGQVGVGHRGARQVRMAEAGSIIGCDRKAPVKSAWRRSYAQTQQPSPRRIQAGTAPQV